MKPGPEDRKQRSPDVQGRGCLRRLAVAASQAPIASGDIRRALGILALTTLAVGLIAQAFTTGLPKVFDDFINAKVSRRVVIDMAA